MGACRSAQNQVEKRWTDFLSDHPAIWWCNRCSAVNRPEPEQPSTGTNTVSQFVAALKSCAKARDLDYGKELHQDAIAAGIHLEKHVGATLITMYTKCRSMAFAREVFDAMIHRDTVVWTSMILAYGDCGEALAALDLFAAMDCEPDWVAFLAALKACKCLASGKNPDDKRIGLERGIEIHKQVRERGFESCGSVASILVEIYCKSGSNMDRASEVFSRMSSSSKDVVTWTNMILGFVQDGKSSAAIDMFVRMECEPDSFAYVAALKACGTLGIENPSKKQFCLEKGMIIHKQVRDRGGCESDVFVASALVDLYSKCGIMDPAREIFDGMARKDVVVWTSLILGYVQNGKSLLALDLFFERMDCEPNAVTYMAAIKACASLAGHKPSEKRSCLENGIAIHKQAVERGFGSNLVVASSLVDMYSKCGRMELAKQVFDSLMISKNSDNSKDKIDRGGILPVLYIPHDQFFGNNPDCISYVAAIKACGSLAGESKTDSDKRFCLEKGMSIHRRVQERGLDKSDMVLASSLVDMYSKCGSMDRARQVFDRMIRPDVRAWTCLIQGYAHNGDGSCALDLFTRVDCEPDCFTFIAALSACADLAAMALGQQIHARMCRLGMDQDRPAASNALMDFYGKCGGMNSAHEIFNNMADPDVVSWTSLIAGYSFCGNPDQVFTLAKNMKAAGVEMNQVTFTCILTACSHAGLIEEGRLFFELMVASGLDPGAEQHTCMIDMLGRANKLQEALALVKNLPFEADLATWRTLLAACRKWKNVEVGKAAFDAMGPAGPRDSAACTLMNQIYGSSLQNQEQELERTHSESPLSNYEASSHSKLWSCSMPAL